MWSTQLQQLHILSLFNPLHVVTRGLHFCLWFVKTEATRRRWRFLGHIPLQGTFSLAEVSLTGLLPPQVRSVGPCTHARALPHRAQVMNAAPSSIRCGSDACGMVRPSPSISSAPAHDVAVAAFCRAWLPSRRTWRAGSGAGSGAQQRPDEQHERRQRQSGQRRQAGGAPRQQNSPPCPLWEQQALGRQAPPLQLQHWQWAWDPRIRMRRHWLQRVS